MLKMNVLEERTYRCKTGTYDASRVNISLVLFPLEAPDDRGVMKKAEHPDNGKTVIAFEGRENAERWLLKNGYIHHYSDDLWETPDERFYREQLAKAEAESAVEAATATEAMVL